MQPGDDPPTRHAISAKDSSILSIAIAATLNRHDELFLAWSRAGTPVSVTPRSERFSPRWCDAPTPASPTQSAL